MQGNKLKKSYNPLANPFNTKKNVRPLDIKSERRQSKYTQNGSQIMRIPTQNQFRAQTSNDNINVQPLSPKTIQTNRSMAFNNPLQNNFHSKVSSKKSLRKMRTNGSGNMEIYSQRVLNNKNPYENYRYLTHEIERKDERLRFLENEIKNTKFSEDVNEIEDYKSQIDVLQRQHQHQSNKKQNLYVNNEKIKNEIKAVDQKIKDKVGNLRGQERNVKTVKQLRSELNGITSVLNEARGEWSNLIVNDKIEVEKKFKNQMEAQLFEIILKEASTNTDPKINDLYMKLKNRKLKKVFDGF